MANYYVGRNAEKLDTSPEIYIDRVILSAGDDTSSGSKAQTFYSPEDEAEWNLLTGKIVSVTVPFGTQSMADSIRDQLYSVPYRPYSSKNAELDLAYELGDYVTIDGTYSLIGKETIYLNDMGTTDVSADDDGIAADKYPYLVSSGGMNGGLFQRIFNILNQILYDIWLLQQRN